MLINGVGAAATGVTLVVVFVAKFTEGAWITALLIPLMLVTFGAVRRHYHRIEIEILNSRPLDATGLRPPIVIVPMNAWNKMSQKGLRFALKLSQDIIVVQVRAGDKMDELQKRWPDLVEAPARGAGLPAPRLVQLHSPYRHVLNPIIDYVFQTKDQNPDRQIVVLIPELVAYRWYHHLLHNKRAGWLKAHLLLRGDQNIVVINVPWYLSG